MSQLDSKLAKQILKIRKIGYNPWLIGVFSRRQMIRIIVLLIFGVTYFGSSPSPSTVTALALAGGILIGAMINEIVFVFRISRTWSFTEKVTDWNLVEKLAGQKRNKEDPTRWTSPPERPGGAQSAVLGPSPSNDLGPEKAIKFPANPVTPRSPNH